MKNSTNRRIISLCICLYIILSGLVILPNENIKGDGSGNYPPPINGDWIITNETHIENETIVLNGNLTIENNGLLVIENVTLLVNSSLEHIYLIEVMDGGVLRIFNSNISHKGESVDPFDIYCMVAYPGSGLIIKNGYISGFGGWDSLEPMSMMMPPENLCDYGFHIKTDDAIVENCTVVAKGGEGIYISDSKDVVVRGNNISHGHSGITLCNTEKVVVEGNTIKANRLGIQLFSSNKTEVKNNEIFFNNKTSDWLSEGFGISVEEGTNNVIENNRIYNNSDKGIFIHSTQSVVVSGNEIYSSRVGLAVEGLYSAIINNNKIHHNEKGLELMEVCESTIETNEIYSNDQGIYAASCGDLSLINNSISSCDSIGVYMVESYDCVIRNNSMIGNDVHGMKLEKSPDNIIENNIMYNNDRSGLEIFVSDRNIVNGNDLSHNGMYGIDLTQSHKNKICNNTMNNDQIGLYVYPYFDHTVDQTNTVDGRKVYYFYGKNFSEDKPMVIANESVGHLTIAESSYIVVANINLSDDFGVNLCHSNHITIKNSTFNNNTWSIRLMKSDNNTISNNTISNSSTGIFMGNYKYSMDNVICYNRVIDNTKGIYLYYSDRTHVIYNHIINNFIGIDSSGSTDVFVEGNTFHNNTYALNNRYASGNIIKRNIFIDNIYASLCIEHTSNNTFIYNNYSYNEIALEFSERCYDNQVSHNDFMMNNISISIDYLSCGNILHHNNFLWNKIQAQDNGTNSWDDGSGEGNYWTDYFGADGNGDGIGDTPYSIPSGSNVDNYPLMQPYSGQYPEPSSDYWWIIAVVVIVLIAVIAIVHLIKRKSPPIQDQESLPLPENRVDAP